MSESTIQKQIILEASKRGHRLFRNNVAVAWVGKLVLKTATRVILEMPRPLHAGLCVGSSDVIGISKTGRFVAFEVKSKGGRSTEEQRNFLAMVNRLGGIAAVVWSADEAINILESQ